MIRPRDPAAPFDATFWANPQEILAWYREHRPVAQVKLPDGPRFWLITRYNDAVEAMTDSRLVSDHRRFPDALKEVNWSSPTVDLISMWGRNLSNSDSPEHEWFKAPIAKHFTPRRVEAMRPQVQSVADTLLNALSGRDEVDLLAEYAVPLTVTVICQVLGIPAGDHAAYVEFVGRTASVGIDGDITAHREASARCGDLMAEYVTGRVPVRESGVISDVLDVVRSEGVPVDDRKSLLLYLFNAGSDTSAALIGTIVEGLLARPELLAKTRDNPALTAAVIEEFCRFDGPGRLDHWLFAAEDITIGDQYIAAGDMVVACLGSANRDPARFNCPDDVDIDRANSTHVAFGRGPHYCTGAPLALLEAEIAISSLIHRFPHLSLAVPRQDLVRRPSVTLNGFCALPVRLGGCR